MAHLQPRQQLPPAPARPERRGGGEVRTRGHVARARLAVLNGGVEDEACGWGRLTAARVDHRQQAARRAAEEKHRDGTADAAAIAVVAAVAAAVATAAAVDTAAKPVAHGQGSHPARGRDELGDILRVGGERRHPVPDKLNCSVAFAVATQWAVPTAAARAGVHGVGRRPSVKPPRRRRYPAGEGRAAAG